jgi:hypothetical protein
MIKSEDLKNADADLAEAEVWLDRLRAHPELAPEMADLVKAAGFLSHAIDDLRKYLVATERR